MLAFVYGKLIEKALTRAVIDVNGVGYELFIPMSTYDKLPRVNETVQLMTYLHFRQDLIQLYGFMAAEEKTLFLMLITSVSGVGPKLALNILSSMPVNAFSVAIVNGDIKSLSRISGIGKRSAERLVIELKDKIVEITPEVGIASPQSAASSASQKAIEDSVSGLITLGFKLETARKTNNKLVQDTADSKLTPESLIRQALIILNN